MIGWSCSVGYTSPLDTYPDTINLTNITFTDNGIFSIGTVANEFVPASNTTYLSNDGYKGIKVEQEELISICMNVLGEDYSVTYGVPMVDNNRALMGDLGIGYLSYVFPSFLIQYPNLQNILSTTDVSVWMYIPSLKRLLLFDRYLSRLFSIYSVQDGACTRIPWSSRRTPPLGLFSCCASNTDDVNRLNAQFGTLILKGCDGTLESILNSPIYTFSGGYGANRRNYYIFYHEDGSTEAKSLLNALFTSGNYAPPDKEYIVPTNPYEPIDPSGPSEGEGTFDFESDPVPLPSLPSISSADTGFTRIFNPTLAQVRALANYMWTDESFFSTAWNRVKQVFENPMSAIIAFNLVPVPVPDGGNVPFKLMYIDTGVTMNTAANQFVDVDCGTLEVEKVYGSALDYSPYTKISCFLPFVGTVTLNTDEVMNRTLQVTYRVDICSGACVAVILVDGTVMYQFTGHCAINIPMNGADFSTYVSALTAAAKIGLGAATGAGLIAAAAPVPEVTQTTSQTTTRKTERNPETGRQITSWTKDVQRNVEETVTKASHDGLTPANVANTVGSVMGSKPYIERSGSFTGNSGYLGVRRPYLIIERPNLCMPANFQSLNGFPAMMTLPLSSCKGFTRVQQVQLTKCTATNPEQAEILEFLKAGVYL